MEHGAKIERMDRRESDVPPESQEQKLLKIIHSAHNSEKIASSLLDFARLLQEEPEQ